MNREIKFRAWDKKTEQWVNPAFLGITLDGKRFLCTTPDGWISEADQERCKDIILLQYTGLKDSKGTEIYEGDIVKHESDIYHVQWSNAYWEAPGIKRQAFTLGSFFWDKAEVIGDIYQNPELLDK